MTLDKDKIVYFIGIGGTGMAAVAGLAQEAGLRVEGSDANLYPPMSTMLEELKIPVKTPYSPDNFSAKDTQLAVVANALSRGHEELEAVLASKVPYTSFPAFLGEHFLKNRCSVVIAGTHGKTTTSSLMAHILYALGEDPGYVIGGRPRNLPQSFHLGKGACFVVEGDEYDTAFFDKNSKFLHYHPKHLILNNLEFDHADIFEDLKAIEAQFSQLVNLVEEPSNIVANIDDPGIAKLLTDLQVMDKVTQVSGEGQSKTADVYPLGFEVLKPSATAATQWRLDIHTQTWSTLSFPSQLVGKHNIANFCQAIACLENLIRDKKITREISKKDLEKILSDFSGVGRRLDHLASVNGIDIYEDFAHHPTAVKTVLDGLRQSMPDKRLLVAFEPKNATSRRSIFTDAYAASLDKADLVFIGACPMDKRIQEEERMDTGNLASLIGAKACAYDSNEALLEDLSLKARSGDTVVFMSSGSFSGIQYQIRDRLD